MSRLTWLLLTISAFATAQSSQQISRNLITNGQIVSPGAYPFFVFNRYGSNVGCGGTLVWDDIVLTAAHCLRAFQGRGVYVGAEVNFGFDGDAEFHEDEVVILHPDYNSSSLLNDISVIKLQTSSSKPHAILNRDAEQQIVGTPMTVIGFGDTTFRGDLSPDLLETQVSGFDFSACVKIHEDQNRVFDDIAQFCALGLAGRDSCDGDSGGPLLLSVSSDKYIQMGIVSSGLGCGDEGIPALYTRVSTYINWIEGQICVLSSNPPVWCRTWMNNDESGNVGGGAVDATAEQIMYNNTPSTLAGDISSSFKSPWKGHWAVLVVVLSGVGRFL